MPTAEGFKDHILREIDRIARSNGGVAPGQRLFENETGIGRNRWRGKFWARWSDALSEAGHSVNVATEKVGATSILDALARATRHYGRFPSDAELRLFRRNQTDFPAMHTIRKTFPTKSAMVEALRERARVDPDFGEIERLLTSSEKLHQSSDASGNDGWVYLLRMGTHYKVGRSDAIERRIKEINIALPESATLVHAMKTDDPSGIEAYWHRRFAEKRANGEWFALTAREVAAFRRRKFM